jgi:hypothetical protein
MRRDPVAMTETAGLTSNEGLPQLTESMRVLVVAGIPVGVVIAGIGSRLAMLLLRLTSPERVHGVTSDDGFTIGRVTVSGTYNLMLLGSAIGIIGAVFYRFVAPWLIGPTWFRRLTTGVASAAVVGSMLVHADGIDFTMLKPKWLAIGLFVALPGFFGALIGAAVDSAGRPDSWTIRGRRRWLIPVIAIGCFPLSVLPIAVAIVPVGLGVLARRTTLVRRVRGIPLYALTVRTVWLLIGVAGLIALVNDIEALT